MLPHDESVLRQILLQPHDGIPRNTVGLHAHEGAVQHRGECTNFRHVQSCVPVIQKKNFL